MKDSFRFMQNIPCAYTLAKYAPIMKKNKTAENLTTTGRIKKVPTCWNCGCVRGKTPTRYCVPCSKKLEAQLALMRISVA